ncbi:CRISPR-associated endonuclease Cas2, partial [Nocardioides hankookensis]
GQMQGGGAGGLLASFAVHSDDAAAAQQRLADAQKRVSSTLDAQTGAYTRRTKAQLVDDMASAGMLESAKSLNLNLADMATVTMRGTEAIVRWRTQMAKRTRTDEEASSVFRLSNQMMNLSDGLQSGQRGWLLNAEAMGKNGLAAAKLRQRVNQLGNEYGLLPREVRTIVNALDADSSRKKVLQLAEQYNKTPATIRTIFRILGADDARDKAKGVNDQLARTGNTKPNMQPWLVGLRAGLTQGRTDASSGGESVGNALQAGVIRGFSGTASELSEQASYAVHQAVAAARAAGKMRSPSRRMDEEVGAPLAKGAVIGFRRESKGLSKAGVNMIDDLVTGINKHWIAKKKVLDAILAEVGDRRDKLKATVDARDSFASGFQRLGTGIFSADYSSKLTTTSTSKTVNPLTGEVTETSTDSTRALTIADLIAQAQAEKSRSATTKRNVNHLVKDLGLSPALIRQMQAEGDVAGIDALAAGSKDQIALLNSLNKQTQGNLSAAGMTAANKLYGSEIERRRNNVELGETVAKALEKYLDRVVFTIDDGALKAKLRKMKKDKDID